MKKTILHAVIFSIIIHLLIIGFPIVKGYLPTKSHSPRNINTYGNVYVLQNEIAFGIVYNSDGSVF